MGDCFWRGQGGTKRASGSSDGLRRVVCGCVGGWRGGFLRSVDDGGSCTPDEGTEHRRELAADHDTYFRNCPGSWIAGRWISLLVETETATGLCQVDDILVLTCYCGVGICLSKCMRVSSGRRMWRFGNTYIVYTRTYEMLVVAWTILVLYMRQEPTTYHQAQMKETCRGFRDTILDKNKTACWIRLPNSHVTTHVA